MNFLTNNMLNEFRW